jgi:predicted type IV restriction endonuclease/negative regulator of replication initiation
MQADLQSYIETKKITGTLPQQSEEATKQGFILPVFQKLGWNPFDVQEVYPEFSVQNGRVDYSLRIDSRNKVFVEVKKLGEDLDKHQEQLLQYAFKHGVKLAILTNGTIWWFYLPLHEGSWEQRRFYTIDMQSQAAGDIAEKLMLFLAKPAVVSGQAISNAENVYTSQQRREVIEQTLPKAWRKLLAERDELLSDVVAEVVEKLSGYKPESPTVIQFLKDISGDSSLLSTLPTTQRVRVKKVTPKPDLVEVVPVSPIPKQETKFLSFEYSKPTAFRFDGATYLVSNWAALLKTSVQIVAQKHSDDLINLTALVGKKRPYFTTDKSLLRQAVQIPGTDLFYETNLSANNIVQLVYQIINVMGYPKEALQIETTAGSI